MTTPPYDSLLDEKCLTIWVSPSGKRHVGGWFGMVLCGAFVDSHNGWHYGDLTSVRWLGKIAQGIGYGSSTYCKRCVSSYKDVNVNA
jgi:hypothetical protein